MKTLRLLLLVVLMLAEPLRAFGVEVMAIAARGHTSAPARATAQLAQSAAAVPADCAMTGMATAVDARPGRPDAPGRHPPCPLCSVVGATPPAALAFAPTAPRQSVRRHGSMPFRSVVADALVPPPRSTA